MGEDWNNAENAKGWEWEWEEVSSSTAERTTDGSA
jgi:hypothetical protein